MDGVGAGSIGGGEEPLDRQVCLGRGDTAERDRDVDTGESGRAGIGLRVDADRANPETARGAGDPSDDLSPVGDEQPQDPHRHILKTP